MHYELCILFDKIFPEASSYSTLFGTFLLKACVLCCSLEVCGSEVVGRIFSEWWLSVTAALCE